MLDVVTMDTFTLKRQSLRNWVSMSNQGGGVAIWWLDEPRKKALHQKHRKINAGTIKYVHTGRLEIRLMAESPSCSGGGPGFSSQHPNPEAHSHLVTPAPGDLTPSSGILGYYIHMQEPTLTNT